MRHAWLSILLISGVAHADDDEPTGTCSCEAPGPPKILTIGGTVYLKSTGERGAGATITVVPHGRPDGREVYTAITDELGEWRLSATPGRYDVTVYYLDTTLEQATNRLIVDDLVLEPIVIDDSSQGITCWGFGWHASPELTSMPRFGVAITRNLMPVARDRTHRAWIAPVAFADPARAVTTVDGARRFTGAPGIPVAFLEEVVTHSVNAPLELAQGSGGAAAVTLRAGSNENRGDARVVLGLDDGPGASAGAETVASGPLVENKLWVAAGLVARRDRSALSSDGMLRVDGRPGDAHEIEIAGLAHSAGDERAGFSTAGWKAKLDDARLEIGALASAELLDRPATRTAREVAPAPTAIDHLDRTGALGYLKLRFRARGHHTLYATAGGGIGDRDGLRHTDESYAIGDEWMPKPSVILSAGVRAERRSLAADRTHVIAPRAAVSWDPTKEGRGEVFVAYQRVPLVDDGMPGDWRSLPLITVDELATGFAYSRSTGHTMIGLAARARSETQPGDGARIGGEGWLRREGKRTVIHLQATSLDRVATLLAQRKLRDRGPHKITAGVTARIDEDHSEGGLAVGWRRSPQNDKELKTELALEGYAGSEGPGGRMLLGILW